jgi:myo-inositol-1(or 4)-monophosphatase
VSADERVGTASRAQLAGPLALAGTALPTAVEIARTFPDDGIVEGEERLTGGLPRGRYTWIVARGVPGSSVCVGVLRDRMPFAGAVYDEVTRWLFTACAGRGAWLNDRPLYAGRALRSPRALITADGPEDDRPWPCRAVRLNSGGGASIALRLCYVAVGGVDAVHERGVSLMDLAGAAPIVMEAGGVLSSADGAPLFPAWPALALSGRVAIVAGNPAVHRAFTERLPGCHPPVTRSADTGAR